MAVTFLQEFSPTDDRSTANYDTIKEQLGVDEDPPAGLIVHSAGYGQDGTFRIVDVWESQEHLDRFLSERLMPVVDNVWESQEHLDRFLSERLMPVVDKLMAANPDAPPPARQESYELHNVMTGVRSGVS